MGTDFYAKIGGWAFDETGERKSLVFDKCLTAVRVKDGAEKNCELANSGINLNADEPVQIGEPTGQKCEFCGCFSELDTTVGGLSAVGAGRRVSELP